MNQREIDVLEKCIEIMKAGGSLEDCVKQIGDITPEIREILGTAKNLIRLGDNQVSSEQMKRSLTAVLSQAALLTSQVENDNRAPKTNPLGLRLNDFLRDKVSLTPLVSKMAFVFGITALLVLLSGGLVITSAKSLPGDSLYPVKRAVEDLTVYFVPSKEIKLEYEVNYSQQRVDEVNRLIGLKRLQTISFDGVLQNKSSSIWVVSGIPVIIQADTIFVGDRNGFDPYTIGAVVEVEGTTNSQGGVTANEIHLRRYQFIGTVEKIDNDSWQISGVVLSVSPHTQVEYGIKVGDMVSVLIRSEDNGLNALSIQSAGIPLIIPTVEQSSHSESTDIIEPTEHLDTENHEAITTTDSNPSYDSNEAGYDELQSTPVAPEQEHERSSTPEPSEEHESEHTTTPDQHVTPEETEEH